MEAPRLPSEGKRNGKGLRTKRQEEAETLGYLRVSRSCHLKHPEKNSAVVFSSAAGCDQIFLRKESGFFIVQLGATRFSCEESRDFFIDMKVVLCKFPALDGDKSPPAVLQAAQSASGSQPVKQAVPVLFSWSIVSLLPLEFSKITMFCCGCRWR
ncbi:hypothetical protein AVEN_20022-1 [Araneus ventricosus]|uniref:Uncharacterized protein n=1 Tax=Araneus ventricosus TaxID=182803 RepID=A0A4Y2J741_ARAVE|nr:hypothetical protein AVEN_20022-1 [Araneus ventricosus]